MGGFVAISSPVQLNHYAILGFAALCFLSLLYFLFSPFAFKQILFAGAKSADQKTITSQRMNLNILPLFLAQLFFMLISWVFFYTMEFLTRQNARIQALEPGSIVELVRQKSWTLGLCPWIAFAIIGVGLAYLAIRYQRTPTIPAVLFPNRQQHPSLFFHNYCQIVVDTVLLGPPIYLFSLTLTWCAETLCVIFDWPSLFLYPWKTTVAFLLIILVFRNSHQKWLDYLLARNVPLGGVLALYAIGIAAFLFWAHSIGSWFTFGLESTHPNEVMKSPLAGNFSKEILNHRLELLIIGWWGIWTPHIASLIARLSIGKRVFEACLHAILLPVCFFLFILPKWDLKFLQLLFPENLNGFQHGLIALFLLFSLMLIFGQIRNTESFARMAMPFGIGKPIKARSLKKWFLSMIAIFICYMTGQYILGWAPSQVVATLGWIFMTSVFIIFLLRMVIFTLFERDQVSNVGRISMEMKNESSQ